MKIINPAHHSPSSYNSSGSASPDNSLLKDTSPNDSPPRISEYPTEWLPTNGRDWLPYPSAGLTLPQSTSECKTKTAFSSLSFHVHRKKSIEKSNLVDITRDYVEGERLMTSGRYAPSLRHAPVFGLRCMRMAAQCIQWISAEATQR